MATKIEVTCSFLVGRPQIGKTGAFLHLLHLLRQRLNSTSFAVLEEESVIENSDSENEEDDLLDQEDLGPFPQHGFLFKEKWSVTGHKWVTGPPGIGKYGDPACRELYDYYVNHHNSHPPPNAAELGRGTSAVAKKRRGTSDIAKQTSRTGPISPTAPAAKLFEPELKGKEQRKIKAKYLAHDASRRDASSVLNHPLGTTRQFEVADLGKSFLLHGHVNAPIYHTQNATDLPMVLNRFSPYS